MLRKALLLLVSALMLTVLVFAQTGTVNGTVIDPQGGKAVGARVLLFSADNGYTGSYTFTNSVGAFTFNNVTPNYYTVRVVLRDLNASSTPFEVVSGGTSITTVSVGSGCNCGCGCGGSGSGCGCGCGGSGSGCPGCPGGGSGGCPGGGGGGCPGGGGPK